MLNNLQMAGRSFFPLKPSNPEKSAQDECLGEMSNPMSLEEEADLCLMYFGMCGEGRPTGPL